MKKVFGLVLLMLIVVVGSQAQEVALGIKGGLNFAKLDANSSASSNFKGHTGYNAGAFLLLKFSKIAIQPEVLFSEQGSKVNYSSFGSSSSAQTKFNYVNVPILLKLYTVLGINIQVGPQFGFLTNNPVVQNPTAGSPKEDFKKSDLSAALGLGWDLPFGLSIDARYNLGLAKIQSSSNFPDAKNQVFQISIGYKLIKFGH